MAKREKKKKPVSAAPKSNDDGLSTVLLVLYLIMGFVLYLEVILCVGIGQMMIRSSNAQVQNISASVSGDAAQRTDEEPLGQVDIIDQETQEPDVTASQAGTQAAQQVTDEPITETSSEAPTEEQAGIQETVSQGSNAEAQTVQETKGMYVGSIEQELYHTPSCQYASQILPENEVWYSSLEEALAADRKPCSSCG